MKTRIVYTGLDANPNLLQDLSKQPGEVWLEWREKDLVIVHEFKDLAGA